MEEDNDAIEYGSRNKFIHDMNNQLSGITLALAQLRYEIVDPTEDCLIYLDMIATSCNRINELVKNSA